MIPAHNECETLEETVAAALAVRQIKKVIVVDDGSTDQTAKKAKECGAEVVRLRRNSGKGKALALGLKRVYTPWVLFLDADLGNSFHDLKAFITTAQRECLDLAIASPKLKKGGFGLLQAISVLGTYFLTGHKMKTPLSGQRLLKTQLARMLLPFSDRFGVEIGINVDALRLGLKVREIPSTFSHRHTGRTIKGFLHRSQQTADVIRTIGKKCLSWL